MIAQTNRVDLHTHSSASDGTDSPRELVAHARELGLRAIALTDHEGPGTTVRIVLPIRQEGSGEADHE